MTLINDINSLFFDNKISCCTFEVVKLKLIKKIFEYEKNQKNEHHRIKRC